MSTNSEANKSQDTTKARGNITILMDRKHKDPSNPERTQYGFVRIRELKLNVFFNTLTTFENTDFESLKLGDRAIVHFKTDEYGPYATTLSLVKRRTKPKLKAQESTA